MTYLAGRAWSWLLLTALAALPFAGSLSREPLWDDAHYVFDNPTLADRSRGRERIWRGDFLMDYYPVTQSLLWAEYGWFGKAVRLYRLANLLLHAAGAAAVWQAARIWRLPWPWLMAAVWACHPTHVDAVCWISQHKATVAAVLFAATLCLAGLARDRPCWRGWGVYWPPGQAPRLKVQQPQRQHCGRSANSRQTSRICCGSLTRRPGCSSG